MVWLKPWTRARPNAKGRSKKKNQRAIFQQTSSQRTFVPFDEVLYQLAGVVVGIDSLNVHECMFAVLQLYHVIFG